MLLLENNQAIETHFAMGTVMSHKVYGMYAEDALTTACREITWLENQLSRFIPESEVSRINHSAGVEPVKVSPDTFEILVKAFELCFFCPKCFDITIAPLVALWNIGKDTFIQPAEKQIKRTLALVNYLDLVLDDKLNTAYLNKKGQSIDLDGIGKGFAGDRIRGVFQTFGIRSAYSNLGGNVIALGSKPNGAPWQIGIQHPRKQDHLIGSVSVSDQSVVTSGDYQRYSSDPHGRKFHHILNPSTGYPVESGLTSVTVVSETSIIADALSTALFVAGIENGLKLLKSFPKTEAILVDAEDHVFVSKGLHNQFQPDEGIQFSFLE